MERKRCFQHKEWNCSSSGNVGGLKNNTFFLYINNLIGYIKFLDFQAEKCPLLIFLILLNKMKMISPKWFLNSKIHPILSISPRFLAVCGFYMGSLGNLILEDEEAFKNFFYKKKYDYNFAFIRRQNISESKFMVLSKVELLTYT